MIKEFNFSHVCNVACKKTQQSQWKKKKKNFPVFFHFITLEISQTAKSLLLWDTGLKRIKKKKNPRWLYRRYRIITSHLKIKFPKTSPIPIHSKNIRIIVFIATKKNNSLLFFASQKLAPKIKSNAPLIASSTPYFIHI